MVPQPPGSWRNLSALPSTLTSILRSFCVSFLGGRGAGRRAEGKEHLECFSMQCHLLSFSLCAQTGPRGTQKYPGDWRPPSPGSRHRLRAAGSLLGFLQSELKMDTDIATARSRFPSNPKLKRSCFFSLVGSIGIPPSTEGPDGAGTQLKFRDEGEGKRGREYLLRSWLENKIMETSCCFKKGFCC